MLDLAEACLDAGVSSAVLLTFYGLFARRLTTPKRRAWLLTLANTAVVGAGSLPYVYAHVFPTFDSDAVFTETRAARFLVGFFVTFLFWDLAVGSLHYPGQIHLFVGWVHHIVYISFFLWLLKNGLAVGAATTLCLEIPTFLLALGHCFPAQRRDLLYGLLFFAFRVVFHSYLFLCWYTIENPPFKGLWIATLSTLGLHCHWFAKWCRNYVGDYRKRRR